MRPTSLLRPKSWGLAALAAAGAVWAWSSSAAGPEQVGGLQAPWRVAIGTVPAGQAMPDQEGAPAAGRPSPGRDEPPWDAQAAIRQGTPYADVIARLQLRRAPGDLVLASQLARFCVQAQGWRLAGTASTQQRAARQSALDRCQSLGPEPAATLAALQAQRQALPDSWLGWQQAWSQGSAAVRRQMLAKAPDSRLVAEALLDPQTRWSAGGWSADPHSRLTLSDSALQWSLCQSQGQCASGLGPEALQRCVEDGLCASSDQAFWQQAVQQEEAAMPGHAQQQARGQREALARVIRQGAWHELDWQPLPAISLLKAQVQG